MKGTILKDTSLEEIKKAESIAFETFKSLNKELTKISNQIAKLNGQSRFMFLNEIIINLIGKSKLPVYTIVAVLEGIKTSILHTKKQPVIGKDKSRSYIG